MQRLSRWLLDGDGTGSGPAVAWLFQRVLAFLQMVAFASLAVQVRGLIGSRGALPWAPFAEAVRGRGISWLELPSVLRLASSDAVLQNLAWAGVALAAAALVGLAPRALLAVNGVLYLGFVVAGRDFFSFQWDSMLVETTLLALFLPTDRRANWIHLLFRVLTFKLYFESGIAKWNSALHDWHSGAAMTLYYETAPLPTRLAWYAHHLPIGWHHFESWATLALELGFPFFIFGPRLLRRIAFAGFSGFQLVDILTANYGFFCYLSLALNLFLLDDRDLPFLRALKPHRKWEHPALLAPLGLAYLALSAMVGVGSLAPDALPEKLWPLDQAVSTLRIANAYHLFGSITTERIEPIFEARTGETWIPLDLRYKAGPPSRPPPFVAPHQPRLDFQLWFYGLRASRRPPEYVVGVLEQLCTDPTDVQRFFDAPLPQNPEAIRIRFARYAFTSAEEKRATGAWWHVQPLAVGPTLECRAVRR